MGELITVLKLLHKDLVSLLTIFKRRDTIDEEQIIASYYRDKIVESFQAVQID